MNPLKALRAEYGQSVWLDFIRRNLITTGELRRLIKDDGLRGVTSNPAIFEKAIAGSGDYDDQLKELEGCADIEPMALYEGLAIPDIQGAADVLRSVCEQTKRRDGYVSLEVSPHVANDTQATVGEARRLWKAVGRENAMIKVPATSAGISAIEQLISEAINVNVTLLFAETVYEQAADAYIRGLSRLAKKGGDLDKVASVASFFVSRIDTAIDATIETRLKGSPPFDQRALLERLRGNVAVANARLVYQRYKEILRGAQWQALAAKGASTQRLLWASTSAKNPRYRDVMYVEELIGRDTVNTIPPATMDAFRDHGKPRASLEEKLDEARKTMETLGKVGISMSQVTDQLLDQGVRLFAEAFDKLLSVVDEGRRARFKKPCRVY